MLYVNPSAIGIQSSPHHNVTGFDGTPKVSGYKLKFFLATDDPQVATPASIVDVGKPIPVGGGFNVGKAAWAVPPLALNTEYVAVAVAYGPGGESAQTAPTVDTFTLSDIPAPPGSIVVVE